MITLLSPSKSLNLTSPIPSYISYQTPMLLEHSAPIVQVMSKYSRDGLKTLMNISDSIAELNLNRYRALSLGIAEHRPAAYTFDGDVYDGLEVYTMDEQRVWTMNQNIRILSGLYGYLRPLDMIAAYRLEMGTSLKVKSKPNLYLYWRDLVTRALTSELDSMDHCCLINLASNEYFKVINTRQVKQPIYTCQFLDKKNGEFKMISFFAKRARGLMARYIVDHAIDRPEGLKGFDSHGYRWDSKRSTPVQFVFVRESTNTE